MTLLHTLVLGISLMGPTPPARPNQAATAGPSRSEPSAAKGDNGATTVDLSVRPSPLHTSKAILQLGILVGLGIGWYEWQIELNKHDFDFPRTFGGQWHRLAGAGYRFDDNQRYLNIYHVPVGAMYYQTGRVYGGDMTRAFVLNLATSSLWEVVVEHREVISINDQINTVVAGTSLGEALYRIGDVFARSKPTFMNRVLTTVASPMRLGAWLAGEAPTRSGTFDARGGEESSLFHRFEISLGGVATMGAAAWAANQHGGWAATARGAFEVIALPGYASTETAERDAFVRTTAALRGGELTRLVVEYTGTDSSFRAFDLVARTSVFGRFDRTAVTGPQGMYAKNRVLALASGYELSFNRMGGLTDFLSLVHVIGPTADFRWSSNRLSLRAAANAYGDFAMVRPIAIAGGNTPETLARTKSTLANEQYYYGWGGTAEVRLELAYGRLRAGATLEWNHIDSIEGLDRHQNAYVSPTGVEHAAVADDSNVTDDRLRARLFFDFPIPFANSVSVGMVGEVIYRRGDWEARNLTAEREDRRATICLTYTL